MNECLGKNGLSWAGRGLLHAPGRCVNIIVPTGDQAGLRQVALLALGKGRAPEGNVPPSPFDECGAYHL